MESPSDPSAPDPGFAPSTDRLRAALDRLVVRGVLDQAQAGAVLTEVGAPARSPRPGGLRRLLGEIAGYLGASFVAGAAVLFLGQEWDALGRAGRFWSLAAMAVILIGSGLALRRRTAPRGSGWWRDQPGDSVSRRLSSTLLTAAAAAAAFAAYVLLERTADGSAAVDGQRVVDYAGLVASVTGLAVVSAGYLFARSALGQLGMAWAALAVYITGLDVVDAVGMVPVGLGTLALGGIWAGLAWRRLVAERRFGLAIAVILGLGGAQWVVAGGTETADYSGYALMTLVAGLCFAVYARTRDWVLLAGGVVGATLVVPEFLYDVTGGSLGASGVLLVAGVTLLVGSLAGLRLRRGAGVAQPGV